MKTDKIRNMEEVQEDIQKIIEGKMERKHILKILGAIAGILVLLLVIDGVEENYLGYLFVVVFLPVMGGIGGLAILIYGGWRKLHQHPAIQTFVISGILLMFPIGTILFAFLCSALGLGPVPN